MTPGKLAVALALGSSLLVLPLGTTTAVGSPPPEAATVHAPWLAGNVLHTGDGGTVVLPWTAKQARTQSLRLLGRADGGWLLKSFTGNYRWTTWLVQHGERTKLSGTTPEEGDLVSERIADDGSLYAVRVYNDGNPTNYVALHDLTGADVGYRTFDSDAAVLDLSGTQAVIGSDHAVVWSIASDTVDDLGVPAIAADLDHDLVVVTDPDSHLSGPTSLSAPATPVWAAQLDQVAISPTGGRLVSRNPDSVRRLVVRSVATGEVVATLGIGRPITSDLPVWDSNRSVLFVAATNSLGDHEVLVRCRISGTCTRLTGELPRDAISLATPTTVAGS